MSPQHVKPIMRRQLQQITHRVLTHVEHLPPPEAAQQLGCSSDDIHNMRKGSSNLTATIFLKLVRVGRYSPKSVIEGPKLRKLRKGTSIAGSKQSQVDARVRKIAREMPAKTLTERAGMTGRAGSSLRYGEGHVNMHWLLGLLRAGFTLKYLVFGKRG